MLVKKNRLNKKESIYQCDKCGAMAGFDNKYTIYSSQDAQRVKALGHLCLRCYKKFIHNFIKNVEK